MKHYSVLVYSYSNLKPKPAIFAFIHLVFTILPVFQIRILDPMGCHGPLFVLKFIFSSSLYMAYTILTSDTGWGLQGMGIAVNTGMVEIW